ncbi:NPCBM/NEW2 domain-containing protein [Dactylosporangium sp. AC04546]|uniref:NPCBM/NEW2 domain-containing protein n=1 Tax=Dactylosporangium sp. AC04546 TaxID=2862460 RepID=UPI001EE0BD60|nr:NPCBM/NEW2 domain-containing protein [Dactylosporangium sp. AC04546]WVK82376.1 NPCBM/NEW2 domain-containing protein [Dactylosporangium sp. AC04546]
MIRRTARLAAAVTVAISSIVVVVAGSAGVSQAAATPAPGPITAPVMGWNSWNRFGCNIDESLIRATADALVSTGLRDSGYTYVNIDDCWMASTRDAQGRLRPDPVRFPGGIAALADYVHARGLKLGIYSSAGTATCQGLPASLDHETVDAQTWASWGIDLLKYDNCNNQGRPAVQRYKAMGDALKATGRHIVYSICNWGLDEPWVFGPDVGGSYWRTTGDISDNWGSVTSLLDQQAGLETFARKGFYNDPDMLEVGNGGLTADENVAHFSLWSLLSSPLLLGNDLRSVSASTLAILRNPDVIAVNQDWGGAQGRRVADAGDQEVWAKPMSDGSVAAVLFNRGGAAATVSTSAAVLGLGGSSSYTVRNLWTGSTSTTAGAIAATVPAHGVTMVRVTRAGTLAAPPASGTLQVSDLPWLASSNGWGPAERDRANGEQAAGDGGTLSVGGTTFAKGIGAHADSAVHVYLGRACRTFTAQVGVDGEVGTNGSVRFAVYGDGRLLGYTAVKTGGQAPTRLTVSTGGYLTLELRVTDARTNGIQYDHADWGAPTLVCGTTGAGSFVSDRTWGTATNGWGPAERDASNGEQPAGDGSALTVGGVTYPKGVGAHAASDVTVPLGGACSRFTAVAGLDAEVGTSSTGVTFSVLGDGVTLWTSPTVTAGAPVALDVSVAGRTNLRLVVGSAGSVDYDHADWADARLIC